MASVYQPFRDGRTERWEVGIIIDHVAHPLSEEEVKEACEVLNKWRSKQWTFVDANAPSLIVEQLWSLSDRPVDAHDFSKILARINALRTKENILDLSMDVGKRLLMGVLSGGKKP